MNTLYFLDSVIIKCLILALSNTCDLYNPSPVEKMLKIVFFYSTKTKKNLENLQKNLENMQ